MKICLECNSKMLDNEHLCTYCGAKFELTKNNFAVQQNHSGLFESLHSYKESYNSSEYKKVFIYGNEIYIKEIFKADKSLSNQALMIVEVDGVEKYIYPDSKGDYLIIQGKIGSKYKGPILVAIIKLTSNTQEIKLSSSSTSKPTTNKPLTSIQSTSNQTKTPAAELPKYQYWLLLSSYFLSFTYLAPIIGLLASFAAYSDIESSHHKDKDGQLSLTIGAGVLHAFFIVLGIYSNGGFS